MPAPKERAAVKRKREARAEAPKKRARSESSDDSEADDSEDDSEGDDGDEGTAARIMLLESEILESKKNYNNIVTLLDIAKGEDGGGGADAALVAAVALCRVFIQLLASGRLAKKNGLSEKEVVVVLWLRDRLADYEKVLLGMFGRNDEWAGTALALAMRLLKAEGQHSNSSEEYFFPRPLLNGIVKAVMAQSGSADGLAEQFVNEYVEEFEDIRFYTFKAIAEILGEISSGKGGGEATISPETVFDRAFAILSLVETVPESNDELEDFYLEAPKKKSHALRSAAKHRKQAQETWLALMGVGMNREQRKRVLEIISTVIAPWFTLPELLMDFLTDSYNVGGSMALLALSGVYYLIREKNLDYPAFYPKLYSLLDAGILHSRHRSRFFRLLDTFLSSTHLPAQLVASFIKKLSRLCLNAPPSAIVTVVPFIYNLFKSHPLCTFMIHRVPRTEEEREAWESEGMADPFVPDEPDPMQTRAIDSCLWEIKQLQSHYHPNVATIARIISEQFTKQMYNMDDFLDHSYQSLFDAEMSKTVKKAPVVEFHIPKRIFLPQDAGSGVEDSLLVRLCDFS